MLELENVSFEEQIRFKAVALVCITQPRTPRVIMSSKYK